MDIESLAKGSCYEDQRFQAKRVKWVKPEHPYTAISPKQEVGANHNEALNSSIRRRCSAYRRRTIPMPKGRVVYNGV